MHCKCGGAEAEWIWRWLYCAVLVLLVLLGLLLRGGVHQAATLYGLEAAQWLCCGVLGLEGAGQRCRPGLLSTLEEGTPV
jgi:hypothetical protein